MRRRLVGVSQWTDLRRPPLREPALARALTEGPDAPWRAIEVVPETGSTNAELVARAGAGEPEGLVLAADHQAAGRGRLGRSWSAPPRSSLAVSMLLRPAVDPSRWSWLPLLVGVAVTDALTHTCGVAAGLKWPNDVLIPQPRRGERPEDGERLKVCGILAEAVPGPMGAGAAVLGFGLNVDQERDELPVPGATSLRLAGSATLDRDTVLRACLRAVAARYRRWVEAGGDPRGSGIGAAYREACLSLGLEVEVQLPGSEPVRGVAQEVDDAGRLVVETGAGRRALAAGDVVHVRPAAGRERLDTEG
jgi:BirA family transcriptional regulator, biotin operon repressor / biotin---[acetyl-CoA-carboxylase] ligase